MSRIGVRLDTGPQFTPGDLLELAMLAEDREYDTIWLPEGASDATVQLTAFATATRRIKLGHGDPSGIYQDAHPSSHVRGRRRHYIPRTFHLGAGSRTSEAGGK